MTRYLGYVHTCPFTFLNAYKISPSTLACSRSSVSGAVRRASRERGENEEGLGSEDARPPSLRLSRRDSLAFSLDAVFVRYHQSRAWNRLRPHEFGDHVKIFNSLLSNQEISVYANSSLWKRVIAWDREKPRTCLWDCLGGDAL